MEFPQSRGRHPLNVPEVELFQKDIIGKWKNKFEVWPFAYGDDALATSSIFSSLYTVYFFRRKLKLAHHGRVTCYLPVIGLSAIFADVFHQGYITYKILNNGCSICTEVKASVGQAVIACAYPLAFAPVISFFLADRLFTYPVPPISAPKDVFRLWQKMVRSNATTFLTLCGIQMILAMYVTHEKFNTIPILGIHSESKDTD